MCVPGMYGQQQPQATPPNTTIVVRPGVKDLPLGDGMVDKAALTIKKRKSQVDAAIAAAGG